MNANTITDAQIQEMRERARASGDTATNEICRLALGGARGHRARCAALWNAQGHR